MQDKRYFGRNFGRLDALGDSSKCMLVFRMVLQYASQMVFRDEFLKIGCLKKPFAEVALWLPLGALFGLGGLEADLAPN